jgi:dTMP kinase
MQRRNHPGFLVVLEGIDGSGKSTLQQRLAEWCRTRGFVCTISREPTRGRHGQTLRESARSGRLSLEEELELFEKDRAEHAATLIRPALARGEVVILDRYYFSTAAYQGARGADPNEIILRNEAFAPVPDLVLLLDLDSVAGARRIESRGHQPDDFEALDYQREVRRIFLSLDRPFIHRLDANRPPEAVLADACIFLQKILNPKL